MRSEPIGAAIALAAGLLLGGAMHPDLAGDDRPAGPQTIAGASAVRAAGPFDSGRTLASYSAGAPDYVIGTDARRTMAWSDERPAAAPRAQPEEDADDASDEPATLTRAAYDEATSPPRHGAYPSLGASPTDAEGDAPAGD